MSMTGTVMVLHLSIDLPGFHLFFCSRGRRENKIINHSTYQGSCSMTAHAQSLILLHFLLTPAAEIIQSKVHPKIHSIHFPTSPYPQASEHSPGIVRFVS